MFVDCREEEWLRNRYLAEEKEKEPSTGITLSRAGDIEFMNRQWKGLTAYLDGESIEPFIFEKCNGFLMKYIYQQIEMMTSVWVSKNEEGRLVITKVTDAEIETLKHEKLLQNQQAFQKAMGFSLVFKKLIECKKPMVGHNCFFDLLFLLRWFDGPLNSDFRSLRQRLKNTFPVIFDTK
jgi:hypothetical protein